MLVLAPRARLRGQPSPVWQSPCSLPVLTQTRTRQHHQLAPPWPPCAPPARRACLAARAHRPAQPQGVKAHLHRASRPAMLHFATERYGHMPSLSGTLAAVYALLPSLSVRHIRTDLTPCDCDDARGVPASRGLVGWRLRRATRARSCRSWCRSAPRPSAHQSRSAAQRGGRCRCRRRTPSSAPPGCSGCSAVDCVACRKALLRGEAVYARGV